MGCVSFGIKLLDNTRFFNISFIVTLRNNAFDTCMPTNIYIYSISCSKHAYKEAGQKPRGAYIIFSPHVRKRQFELFQGRKLQLQRTESNIGLINQGRRKHKLLFFFYLRSGTCFFAHPLCTHPVTLIYIYRQYRYRKCTQKKCSEKVQINVFHSAVQAHKPKTNGCSEFLFGYSHISKRTAPQLSTLPSRWYLEPVWR